MKPIGGGLLWMMGAIILLALLWVTPAGSWAAFPGSNGRIAFAGPPPASTASEIFTVLPNGSGLERLTDNTDFDYQPSWSANGRRLVYIRNTADSRGYQVYKMNASGENQTQVTHDDGNHRWPGLSPNGRRILYVRNSSLFRIRPDGTHKRRVVAGYVSSAQYSPNGKQIVFEGAPRGKRQDGIWTIHPDGSHLQRLSAPEKGGNYDEYPEWSPDGRHIAFRRCDIDTSYHGCSGDLFLMRADGSRKHPIEEAAGNPAFSPNGNRIALTDFGGDCSDIYTITRAGSDPQVLTHNCPSLDKWAGQPSWQPIPQP
jgi:Tol biopolymer transport system component